MVVIYYMSDNKFEKIKKTKNNKAINTVVIRKSELVNNIKLVYTHL